MQNLTAALTVAVEEAPVVNELFAPTWVFGVGAFTILLLMLAATMSLTSVSKRHPAPSAAVDVHDAAGRSGQRSGH